MKCLRQLRITVSYHVALFTRAWIEITFLLALNFADTVALFTRAWIEIRQETHAEKRLFVALFTRAWIEIQSVHVKVSTTYGRPLYEGVD